MVTLPLPSSQEFLFVTNSRFGGLGGGSGMYVRLLHSFFQNQIINRIQLSGSCLVSYQYYTLVVDSNIVMLLSLDIVSLFL